MTQKNFGRKRYFLNPKDGVAAGSFHIVVDHRIKGSKWPCLEVDASLRLSDCHRQINLEFDVWLDDEKKKALANLKDRRKKLQHLQNIVNEFVEKTTAAYDYLESHLDEYIVARKKHNEKKE